MLQELSSHARELLAQILNEGTNSPNGVTAAKFRADNYKEVTTLDDLESRRFIRRVDNKYLVTAAALPFIATDSAKKSIRDIEKLYSAIRERYRIAQDIPVLVSHLAKKADLSIEDALPALALMLENSLWSSGHSVDLLRADAFVTPAEGVLKYATFMSTVEQVSKWNSPLPSALSLDTDSSSNLRPAKPAKNLLRAAWPAVRACLNKFTFDDIKEVSGLAGFDVTSVANLVQKSGGGASKGQLMSAIDGSFADMDSNAETRFLTILIEEILRRKPESEEQLTEYLNRLGWSFANQVLVPLHLLDPQDLAEMPTESHKDLLKAAARFRDGDLSGAISGACGAVDSATSLVYQQMNLGDPTQASFQERCRKAVQARGVFIDLDEQLKSLDWHKNDIIPFRKNLESALNQGAYIMQTLRSHMGDVHGSKPILKSLVFDCMRWAELIVGSLVDRDDK